MSTLNLLQPLVTKSHVGELYEDDDLDPNDHMKIIERAFMSSDCDDFAWLLNEVTGHQVVKVTWQDPNWGFGHHTVVRDGDGKLIDVRGETDLDEIRNHFHIKPSIELNASETKPTEPSTFDIDIEGFGNEEPGGCVAPSAACALQYTRVPAKAG